MRKIFKPLTFTLVVGMLVLNAAGQVGTEWKQHPNNVKFNLSSGLIYKNAFILGYERTLGPHQTVSVFGGAQQLPSFVTLVIPGISLLNENRSSGFNIGADYRFYLASENKYAPPHGFYVGPYLSFYSFANGSQAHFTLADGSTADGTLHSDLKVASIGGQLGYQFVFWKRVSLDLLLFGPSLAHYFGKLDIQSTLKPEQVPEEVKKILTAIGNRYPVIGEAIKNGSSDTKGNLGLWGVGFRYSVHVGFRF
jgi:hypothetical protein